MADHLLKGIIPALYTAYDDEGNVSRGRTAKLVGSLLDAGVHGFFVCGTTGEGLLLDVQERKQVAAAVVGEAKGQVPVMVHVGAMCTRDSIDLARHAALLGASAISSIPPIYYPYSWPETVRYFRDLAAATDVPFYIYYIPQLAGGRIAPEQFVEDLVSLPGVAGMKFSAPQLYDMYRIGLLAGPRFNLLSGPDELMVPAALLGAQGAVGSSYNFMPKLFLEAYAALQRGDLAAASDIQLRLNRAIELYHKYGSGLGKALLRLQGLECGDPRPPLAALPPERLPELQQDLVVLGFFDWAR